MPDVIVTIPTLLAQVTDGSRELTVGGETVNGVIEALLTRYPQLRVHIFDEQGSVRPHVSVFHNGSVARSPEAMSNSIGEGDEVTILQAVSGG